jgi:hypothetical protein
LYREYRILAKRMRKFEICDPETEAHAELVATSQYSLALRRGANAALYFFSAPIAV